jgi:tetratricopeptide (TPR) repeat protein
MSKDMITVSQKNASSLVELGRGLRVAFLISGTTRKENGRLQTTLTLTDVETGSALGAEQLSELPDHDGDAHLAETLSTATRLINRAKKVEVERVLALPEAKRDARDLLTLIWPLQWSRSKTASDKSVALAEQAYRLAPDNPRVIVELGFNLALRAENRWSDNEIEDERRAGPLLERVLLSEPDNIQALGGKLINFMGQERWADALAVGQQIDQISPHDYGNMVDNAINLSMLERDEEALKLLDQVPPLVADSHNILLQVTYGKALLALGRVEEAETRFRTAVLATAPSDYSTWPGNADLLHLVATEALLNRPDQAKKFLADYFAANPGAKPLSEPDSGVILWEDSPRLRQKIREGLLKAGVPG